MKEMNVIPYPLPSLVYSAASPFTINLRDIPSLYFGRIVHLAGILFDVKMTPTYTTAPTVYGLNNIVKSMQINDGQNQRFQGGFNVLRFKELLENGKLNVPDPDTDGGSTNPNYVRRVWDVGPKRFLGAPSDFLLPAAALKNGFINGTFGALTDISADCTAMTATVVPVALLTLLDGEIRVPPMYDFEIFSASSADYQLVGRALYSTIALLDSSAADGTAITAGDFASVQLDTGQGAVAQVSTRALSAVANALMQSGHLNQLRGEPDSATDDSQKKVNGGTPTALAAADAVVQAIHVSPPGARITKLPFLSEQSLRVRWSGTQSTAGILAGRILAQSGGGAAAIAAAALSELKMSLVSREVKTLSKADYRGPRSEYMPWAVKVK